MRGRSARTGAASRNRAASAMADAIALCKQRRVQLTAMRRTLLEILWEQPQRPLGAYPLMRRLEAASGRQVTATSVYRALDFLLREGLVMRIESRNAYLPCPEPGTPFAGTFFICNVCGIATGANDGALERLAAIRAGSFGFTLQGRTIELQGVCRRCSKSR